jgi:hypothetical protein
MRSRIWFAAWVLALTAELLAILNVRIASIGPSPVLGTADASPESTERAAAIASAGSDLPFRRRV